MIFIFIFTLPTNWKIIIHNIHIYIHVCKFRNCLPKIHVRVSPNSFTVFYKTTTKKPDITSPARTVNNSKASTDCDSGNHSKLLEIIM